MYRNITQDYHFKPFRSDTAQESSAHPSWEKIEGSEGWATWHPLFKQHIFVSLPPLPHSLLILQRQHFLNHIHQYCTAFIISTLLVYINLNGKGSYIGCGLHGYSLVFFCFFLTGQSNVVELFMLSLVLLYVNCATFYLTKVCKSSKWNKLAWWSKFHWISWSIMLHGIVQKYSLATSEHCYPCQVRWEVIKTFYPVSIHSHNTA